MPGSLKDSYKIRMNVGGTATNNQRAPILPENDHCHVGRVDR